MYNIPPWGYPAPPYYTPPQNDTDPVRMVDGWIKGLKALKDSLKDEEKKDGDKKSTPKSKTYNALEVCGWVMLMALPIGVGQLYMLAYLKQALIALPH